MINEVAIDGRVGMVERMRRKVFPEHLFPFRERDTRKYFRTSLSIHLSWWDRIRLMWSGRAMVKMTIYTGHVLVAEAETDATFYVQARKAE